MSNMVARGIVKYDNGLCIIFLKSVILTEKHALCNWGVRLFCYYDGNHTTICGYGHRTIRHYSIGV